MHKRLDSSLIYDQDSLLIKLLLWIPNLKAVWNLPKRRGRPLVYPWHMIFRGLIFMVLKHLRWIPALDRALRQSPRYQWLCGFQQQLPCQRIWYRRFQQLGEIVVFIKEHLLALILKDNRQSLEVAVVDGSALSSYGRHASKKQKKHKPGDRDATWGKTVTKGWFQGYKLHCLNTTRPYRLPLSWTLDKASSQEANYLNGLLEAAPISPSYVCADKGYDSEALFESAHQQGVFLAAILRNIRPPTPGSKKVTKHREFRKKWSRSLLARSIFRKRTDIERFLSPLKGIFLLDPLPVRHWSNVTAYTDLCILGYLTLVSFNITHQRPALKFQDILCSF